MDLLTSNLTSLHQASKREIRNLSLGLRPVCYERPSPPETQQIPHPDLFESLSESKGADLPSPSQCAVHLELLDVFFTLRRRILSSKALDKAFGTEEEKKTVYRQKYDFRTRRFVRHAVELRDTTWDARRKEKWQNYLDIAAGRFMAWSKEIEMEISTAQVLAGLSLEDKPPASVDLPHLPPLDILMVWHAFLLNPSDFKSHCRREGLAWLPRVTFPWEEIHKSIDANNWEYLLDEQSTSWLQTRTKLEPDLFKYLATVSKKHPKIVEILSRKGQETALNKINVLPTMQDPDVSFIDVLRIGITNRASTSILVNNVKRQASFVDKMHNHLWIRSPAAEGTLRRAVQRYDNFLELFRLYPNAMLVPTLDIDIAWHTHQLSSHAYASLVKTRCGRFIDHNDKIASGKLDLAMDRTEELYTVRFGQPYSTCLCWDCEAITSELEAAEENGTLDEVDPNELAARVEKEVERFRTRELWERKVADSPTHTRH